MPLPDAAEFLAAQRDEMGSALTSHGFTFIDTLVPPNTVVTWQVRPGEYMSYDFRLMADASVNAAAFVVTVIQYGVRPYTATVYPSATGMHIDYFLRVTDAQPIVVSVENITNLYQRWVSADQYLSVANEENYRELERRLARFFGQVQPLEVTLTPGVSRVPPVVGGVR